MTIQHTLIAMLILGLNSARAEDELLLLEDRGRRTGKMEWRLPLERAKELPRWKAGKEAPPIRLEKAIDLAMDWIAVERKKDRELFRLVKVEILPLGNDNEELQDCFYYSILVDVAPFDFASCVVLMDGKILEPVYLGVLAK